MFNTHETLNDLINEMYTYFESKRGREKRKKFRKATNEFKKKLQYKRTSVNKNGDEIGTIQVGNNNPAKIIIHNKEYHGRPNYDEHDNIIRFNKKDIGLKGSYAAGAHELQHFLDNNNHHNTDAERQELKKLVLLNNELIDKANQTSNDDERRNLLLRAKICKTKYNTLTAKMQRQLDITKFNTNSSTVRKTLQNIHQLKKTKNEGVGSHNRQPNEIRADELPLKAFPGCASDYKHFINKMGDLQTDQEISKTVNSNSVLNQKLCMYKEYIKNRKMELTKLNKSKRDLLKKSGGKFNINIIMVDKEIKQNEDAISKYTQLYQELITKRKKYINNLNNLKKVERNKTENRVNMVSKSL